MFRDSNGSDHYLACPPKPAPAPDPAEMLTTKQVAKIMGASPKTVWTWCKSGKLRYVRIGFFFRVRRDWLDEFVRVHVNGPPSPSRVKKVETPTVEVDW